MKKKVNLEWGVALRWTRGVTTHFLPLLCPSWDKGVTGEIKRG